MESAEVFSLVLSELDNTPCSNNFHGINNENVRDFLVEPYKKSFVNPIEETIEEHWVVFDEDKESNVEGYLIFFSEADNSFGLAGKSNLKRIIGAGTILSLYGSFIDTIEAM